jgi:hypothetical protein
VQAGDAAGYQVTVSNPLGAVASSFVLLTTVSADVAPSFTLQPVATNAPAGTTAVLTAAAQGAPAPSYQWYAQGAPIAGATAAVLTLPTLSPAEAGAYDVVATNSAGSATSSTVNLTVHSGASLAGSYFGGLPGGGSFALYIYSDETGVFLGFKPGTLVPYLNLAVTLTPTGGFAFASSAAAPGAVHTQAVVRVESASGSVSGTVGPGGFTGTVDGVAVTAPQAAAGATSAVSGFYEAGAADGSAVAYTVVGPSGQAYVLLETSGGFDGGAGTVSAAGQLSITTAGGLDFAGTVGGSAITATASGAGTTLSFSGVEQGTQAGAAQRMINLSTRASVGAGDQVSIAGFVIKGQASKTVLIRAVGPSLAAYGVTGVLEAPTLMVYSGSTVVASNTGWTTSANPSVLAAAAAVSGAFALTPGSADSALLLTLPPGAYTAVVGGAGGGSGVALAEIYDLSGPASGQELLNLSSRAFAGSGSNTLIAGMVVGGAAPKRLLIRAAGPALTQFGVGGVLASPQLTLYSGATVVAQNAGWSTSADAAAIAQTAATVGAFPYAAGSTDSALIVNLPPGAYTAEVTGVGGTSGVALVEVYEVP